MSLPDPYANEPAVEVSPDKVRLWLAARDAAAQWKQEEERLRAELETELGDAYAGLVDGKKVFTYRPTARVAEQRLIAENRELAEHYIKPTVVDKLDLPAFRAQHPDVVARYVSRQFRAAE